MKDPVGIIERAYTYDAPSETEWLAGIAEVVRANLPSTKTSAAFAYQIGAEGWIAPRSPVILNPPAGLLESLLGGIPGIVRGSEEQAIVQRFYGTAGIGFAEDLAKQLVPRGFGGEYRARVLHDHGFRDALTLNATDPTGSGCLIFVPLPEVGKLPPSVVSQWNRVAAHVAAGFRLHRKIAALSASTPAYEADAVLSPSGSVAHATGAAATPKAREILRNAVRAVDRARGPLRARCPEEAVEVWRGLVSGRWSLVDRFESDGRRYVLAYRNDPAAPDPRGLTPRERQVAGYAALGQSNKLIAYELGISAATVGVLIGRATAKLGFKSRAEFVRDFQPRPS